MAKGLVAKASVTINALRSKVWDALINAEMIKKYMLGAETFSKWEKDSPITWTGIWQGKPYTDKGVVKKIKKEEVLEYTHFSPLGGLSDVEENYHTVTYKLSEQGDRTLLYVTQDNNADEEAMIKSKEMWETMLGELKKLLEA